MVGERVERRLTAILAADVAGYSRLMGKPSSGGHGSFPRTPTRHIPRPSALASVPAGIGDENNVGRPLWRPHVKVLPIIKRRTSSGRRPPRHRLGAALRRAVARPAGTLRGLPTRPAKTAWTAGAKPASGIGS